MNRENKLRCVRLTGESDVRSIYKQGRNKQRSTEGKRVNGKGGKIGSIGSLSK